MKKVQLAILILLMLWLGLFFVHKIDLTTADLGRHIKNGEMVLSGNFGILNTNFYSYTEPEFPVVNHHWGSGLIFYFIWKFFGFSGLSLFYLIASLIVFYLFFRIAQKESNFTIAFIVSLMLIPLMAARREIRPEIISYVFIAVFFWILWNWKNRKLNDKWLFVLPVIQVFWANIHIYFIFGLGLIGLFWTEKIFLRYFHKIKSQSLKYISWSLIITAIASVISPFGIKGLLYPFNIFKNYGYMIVENQSVWFLENWGFNSPNLRLFEIVFGILILSFVVLLIRNKKKFSFIYFILFLVFGGLACLAIRNFTIFGFFTLSIIAYNIKNGFLIKRKIDIIPVIFISLAIFLISFFSYFQKLPLDKFRFGLGLLPENNQSVQFFKDNNLKGPVFNNYDIGGYLIYHFYPDEKVFTDNRPETYSISHFQDSYIPAQQDDNIWQELLNKYDFNVIFFSHRDFTPWGQKFLISRIKDNQWVPVFVDNYAIIFLKRNDLNQQIIEKYEIPSSNFNIIEND